MLLNGFESQKHHLAIVLYPIFGVASYPFPIFLISRLILAVD